MSECASDLRPLQWAELCSQRALGERSALKRTVQTWPFIRNRRAFDQACSIRWNRAWLAMSTEPQGGTLSVAFASASVGAVACASPARSFPVNVAHKRSVSARVVASKTGSWHVQVLPCSSAGWLVGSGLSWKAIPHRREGGPSWRVLGCCSDEADDRAPESGDGSDYHFLQSGGQTHLAPRWPAHGSLFSAGNVWPCCW
jgi:hypothetical protein